MIVDILIKKTNSTFVTNIIAIFVDDHKIRCDRTCPGYLTLATDKYVLHHRLFTNSSTQGSALQKAKVKHSHSFTYLVKSLTYLS